MSIVSGIVLFAVVWFLVLFIVLPIRLETQGDRGEVLSGTHASAPANLSMKRKALITTAAGLTVAIPSYFFYRFFRGMVSEYVISMEEKAITLIDAIERGNVEPGDLTYTAK